MLSTARSLLIGISAASALAMLYVGAYQIRAVDHLKCPILGGGCEDVADAPFARPLGVPDGFIGAGMYGLLLALALAGSQTAWIQYTIRGVAIFATLANLAGVVDMSRLGAFCFYCLLTTALSPFLVWLSFRV